MKREDLERRVLPREGRGELAHVGSDPAGDGEEELIHVERHGRHLDASTHAQPAGPTVAACSVAGGRSRRSPRSNATSPRRV